MTTPTERRKISTIPGAVLGVVVAGSLALVSCGADGTSGTDNASDAGRGDERGAGQVVFTDAEAKEAVPSFTATDWVSYGDQVAVVRVAAEHERPDPESGDDTESQSGEESGSGEEYLPRTVDLRVTQHVWERSDAPALPDSLTVTVDGWEVKDGVRVRVGTPDASRLEVGHDYVISFARYSDGVWSPLGSGGVLPYDDGRVGQGEFEGDTVTVGAYRSALERRLVSGEEPPVAYRTVGKAAAGVGKVLRSAKPDPTAAAHFDLDAPARHQKVTGATTEPADTFCSVAAPLAVSEDSRYTPDELASVLTDLTDLTGPAADDVTALRAYAASLDAGTEADAGKGSADDSARKTSIRAIEKECGIDVGELRPTANG
ncbi:hypothetical protein OG562_26425 [Streptomyces sp. NBC_01275]|uniref:hypothetical protein n=1 Tax=Streptomyces sp. NBC_01275 TaxID=2903807 RepID=UPI002255E90B|nr:hypothetical protein [Streptomyces sp. NBC_01275]MCX4764432.1 hypothetical protein [Streptomyces sp. NBC_01275]